MPGFLLLVFFLALAAAGAYALAYTDVRKLMRWGRYLGPLLMLGGAAGLAVVGRWTLALPADGEPDLRIDRDAPATHGGRP